LDENNDFSEKIKAMKMSLKCDGEEGSICGIIYQEK